MEIIVEGISEAVRLIFSFDREVFEVVGLSLEVSGLSLLIAGILGIPGGTCHCGTALPDETYADACYLYTDGNAAGAVRTDCIYRIHEAGTFRQSPPELYGYGHDYSADPSDPSDYNRTYDEARQESGQKRYSALPAPLAPDGFRRSGFLFLNCGSGSLQRLFQDSHGESPKWERS